MLPVDRKKRHKFCKKTQNFRPFLRQLKQALAQYARGVFVRKISLKVIVQFAILLMLITIYRAIQSFE